MDKNIIIDGVKVAGCYWKCKDGDCAMYYADLSVDNNELEFEFNCEDNPDCYYKQLKRLEQENKELKTWLESKEKQLKHLIEYNQNKKDQIKTLRFMLFDEKEIPKDKFTMMYRIAQNERRTRSHRDLCTNITKKYRSALEEIRVIADDTFKVCDDDCGNARKIKLIIDKINEVLND